MALKGQGIPVVVAFGKTPAVSADASSAYIFFPTEGSRPARVARPPTSYPAAAVFLTQINTNVPIERIFFFSKLLFALKHSFFDSDSLADTIKGVLFLLLIALPFDALFVITTALFTFGQFNDFTQNLCWCVLCTPGVQHCCQAR
jgi:hypothetical protein